MILLPRHPHEIEVYRRDADGTLVRVQADGDRLRLASVGIDLTRQALLMGV